VVVVAARLTDKQKKKILADYAQIGNYSAVAKANGVSDKTVRNIVLKNPEISEKFEEKKEQNTADVIAYMESKRDIVCEILGKGLEVLNNEKKLKEATPAQITTAIGTLIDKWTAISKISADSTTQVPFEIPARLIAPGFIPVHLDILDHGHLEYVEKGGRGSTKSSFVSLEIVQLIKNNPQMHAMCCRKVGNTLQSSVYNQILWAIDVLGLTIEFDTTKSPLEVTYKPTGQKIYFRGADDPMKLKSTKPPFGYIGILWFEELDQFAGDEECRSIQQSVIRGGDEAYIFKSFNPPKAKNNWANKYCDQPKENRLVTHSDYLSVPEKWLGKAFLDEAEYLKEINPDAYDNEYGGVPNGNGGMVFENVAADEITDEQISHFDRILNGLDWGYYPDPWAFNRVQYDAARRVLYIFDELTAHKKGNQESADLLLEHGMTKSDLITADSAEPKSVADYQKFGLKCVGAQKGPGSVDYSMKWLQSLAKIVIDPRRCPETYQEFTEYEYERTKDGEIMSGYPDRDNHHIDAVRYATERVWRIPGQPPKKPYKSILGRANLA